MSSQASEWCGLTLTETNILSEQDIRMSGSLQETSRSRAEQALMLCCHCMVKDCLGIVSDCPYRSDMQRRV